MAIIYKQGVENLSERRIDAWHYQPKLQNQIDKIKQNIGAIFLNDVIDKSRGVASGATPLGANYLKNGKVKFYRTSEVEGMFLDSEKAVYISEDDDEKLARSRLKAGDILLTITGAKFGKSAVVSDSHLPGNISQHSVRFHPKPELIDNYFLVAYLNSDIGQDVIWREAYGATRPAIDFPSVRALTIPKVNLVTQKYIGDKVRQAELLREWAKDTVRKVDSFHLTLVPKQDHLSFDKKFRSVKSFQMTERLDAHFYPSVVEDYIFENNNNFRKLVDLTHSIFNGQTQSECLLGSDSSKQITVANLSSNFLMGKPRIVEELANTSKYAQLYDLLICNAAHNKSYIGKDITYVHSEDKLLPSTEVMVIRVNRDELPASYVRTYLNTKLGYIQIQSTVRGITAHSYPDDVKTLNIYIPKISDKQKEEWFLQDLYLVKAGLSNEYATKLVTVAKYLVEGLISGLISEDQLIQAQNALEQGDTSLDRAILSQMTEDGYAVAGSKPLFSDLDEFYDLLEQAKALE